MASIETWKNVDFFKPTDTPDNWGDPAAIADGLLLRLDDFRRFLGVPVYVSSGVRTNNPKSFHHPVNGACAVDIVVPDYKDSAMDLVLDAERFAFHGIGYYPHWAWGSRTCGGLHLDTRPYKRKKDGTFFKGSRWMGIMQGDKQNYIALNYENMVRFGEDMPIFDLS